MKIKLEIKDESENSKFLAVERLIFFMFFKIAYEWNKSDEEKTWFRNGKEWEKSLSNKVLSENLFVSIFKTRSVQKSKR